jgi:hypothetical protein
MGNEHCAGSRRFYPILAVVVVCGYLLPRTTAQSRPASWSEPVNVGAPINSEFNEGPGGLSADGLNFYFLSNRPCGSGDTIPDANIWVARRSSAGSPWQVECLRINADGFIDTAPELSPDGKWLYFVSDRPGSAGTTDRRDVWVSHRQDVRNDQQWSEPANLGPPVTTDLAETSPGFYVARPSRYWRQLANQKLIFASNRAPRPPGEYDLWEVNVLDGVPFGAARRLEDISTEEFLEGAPTVSPDGLELFFERRPNVAPFPGDIYTSTRRDVDDPWSSPVSLGSPVNTSNNESGPKRSLDGKQLFFSSPRPGGLGGADIWVSNRN